MLNRLTSLAMSTSFLKALPGILDLKRHSPSILYLSGSSLFDKVFRIFAYLLRVKDMSQ